MIARGHVQNGVVVLADGVRLPEGEEVTVQTGPAPLQTHGILEIPPVSLGTVLSSCPLTNDRLAEMLEARS